MRDRAASAVNAAASVECVGQCEKRIQQRLKGGKACGAQQRREIQKRGTTPTQTSAAWNWRAEAVRMRRNVQQNVFAGIVISWRVDLT